MYYNDKHQIRCVTEQLDEANYLLSYLTEAVEDFIKRADYAIESGRVSEIKLGLPMAMAELKTALNNVQEDTTNG
jgi:hypothetical protein